VFSAVVVIYVTDVFTHRLLLESNVLVVVVSCGSNSMKSDINLAMFISSLPVDAVGLFLVVV